MRTILDIPDEQAVRLDALVKKMETSRAALIRRGIDLVLEEEEKESQSRDGAFGMWQAKNSNEIQGGEPVSSESKLPDPEVEAVNEDAPLELNEVVESDDAPLSFTQEDAEENEIENKEVQQLAESSETNEVTENPALEEEASAEDTTKVEEEAKPTAPPAPQGGEIWPASFFSSVVNSDDAKDDA